MESDHRESEDSWLKRTIDDVRELVLASPFGAVVFIAGIVIAVWTNDQINGYVEDSQGNSELILKALRIGAAGLWFSVALWGRQMMVSARDRQDARARDAYYSSVIQRMEVSLRREDEVKQEVTQKSRSFWDRFRSDPQL